MAGIGACGKGYRGPGAGAGPDHRLDGSSHRGLARVTSSASRPSPPRRCSSRWREARVPRRGPVQVRTWPARRPWPLPGPPVDGPRRPRYRWFTPTPPNWSVVGGAACAYREGAGPRIPEDS